MNPYTQEYVQAFHAGIEQVNQKRANFMETLKGIPGQIGNLPEMIGLSDQDALAILAGLAAGGGGGALIDSGNRLRGGIIGALLGGGAGFGGSRGWDAYGDDITGGLGQAGGWLDENVVDPTMAAGGSAVDAIKGLFGGGSDINNPGGSPTDDAGLDPVGP